MIHVEEWCMIRELTRQGLSITDIAQRLGCDRKTVRKYLMHPDQPRYTARAPRARKLDRFKSYVQQRLESGVYNCEVLYRELCAQGYRGKKEQIKGSEPNGIKLALTIDLSIPYEVIAVTFSSADRVLVGVCAHEVRSDGDGVD